MPEENTEDWLGEASNVLESGAPIDIPEMKEDPDKEDPKKEEPNKETKKEEDEEPLFERKPEERKPKKGKDDSIADLRKARDEYKTKIDKYSEVLGEHNPELLKPLIELITERADGPITIETVNNIISEVKERDAEIAELKQQLEEESKRVTAIDIQYDKTFEKKYKKPYADSINSLFAEYAQVGDDKKVLAPELTQKLHNTIVENVDTLDGIGAKQLLQKFAKDFKQETGEDAIIPSVNSLMSSVRSFKANRDSMKEAYENWKSKKAEDEQQLTAQQEQERELSQKRNKRERVNLSSKAFRDFDFDSVDFADEKEVQEFFKEEFKAGEEIFSGKATPGYDEMLTRGVKARLWDKFLPRLKELIEAEKNLDESNRSHIKGSDAFQPVSSKGGGDSWLGPAEQTL